MKTLLNNSKHILGSLLLTTLLFSSCKTTDDNDLPPVEHIPATEQEFKSIKDEALADLTQNFSFNSDDGYITLTSENGVQIGINGDCLTLNGDEISGNVDIEFVEIFENVHFNFKLLVFLLESVNDLIFDGYTSNFTSPLPFG